jgi:hypothetical protein
MSCESVKVQVLEAVQGLAAYGLVPCICRHMPIRLLGRGLFCINAFDRTF